MRHPLALLLLLAPALAAGCVDVPADDAPPEGAADARVLPWGLSGCRFAVAFVPVDAARVQPRLPEGFRVLSFQELGLPADPRGSGNVGTELFVCESGAGLDGTVEPMTYGSVFVAVMPPEEHLENETSMYFVKWDVMIPDDERRALLLSYGVPALPGSGQWASFEARGDQAVFSGSLDMNGTTTFRGSVLAPLDASLRQFRFKEFTPTPDGFVTWHTNVTVGAGAAGGGTLQTSGLMAEIAGTTTAQAYYLAASGDFVDAEIRLPARG